MDMHGKYERICQHIETVVIRKRKTYRNGLIKQKFWRFLLYLFEVR